MNYIVYKFGGTSICLDGINIMKNIIESNQTDKIIFVCSAMSGVTDLLYSLNNKFNIENYNKIIDMYDNLCKDLNIINNKFLLEFKDLDLNDIKYNELISFGELISSSIISDYLKIKWMDSRIYIKAFKKNNIYDYKLVINNEINDRVLIFPGFISSDKDNKIILMSRGGSDTTGSIIANYFKALRYEIWTDVNGVYMIDPNLIKNENIINNISYLFTEEIAALGAKILHPHCIHPLKKHNIPLVIKNTFSDNKINTLIGNYEDDKVFIILKKKNIMLFKLESIEMWNKYGFIADIFNIFKKFEIDIDIVNTSQFSISITINFISNDLLNLIIKDIEKLFIKIEIISNVCIISICNPQINKHLNICCEALNIVQSYSSVFLIHYGDNNKNLSFVVLDNNNVNLILEKLYSLINDYKSTLLVND